MLNTGDVIVQAKPLLKSTETFEFINHLNVWDSLLSKFKRINLSLQENNLDVVYRAQIISGFLS